MAVKMVTVMRTDLGMRKGKMISQGQHAALMCYKECYEHELLCNQRGQDEGRHNAFYEWNNPLSGYRKITVGIDSLEELMDIYNNAVAAHLVVSIVKDLGLTEFKEPTITCICIGPHYDEQIDPFTKHLKLL